MFRNASALLVGRNLNALGRLAITALIVRGLGADVFGAYALIVVWMTIAEWILDFGTVEVFVREANRDPSRRDRLLRVLLALKAVQAPLAMAVLTAGLVVMGYPDEVVRAGVLTSVGLVFLAGVFLCRASFKAALLMEREVLSELLSVLTMLGLVLVLPRTGLGLMGLMGAYVVSRAVFLVACLALSRGLVPLSVRGVGGKDLRWAIRASFAIGLIGFVVVLHNAADLLILSRLASLEDVAVYSGAQRFTIPLMMAMNSLAVSFYPVLAFLDDPERFRETCRRAVDTTLLLGGWAVVGLWCGAELFMSILSPDFVAGADALRILALVVAVKAVALVIGPVLFIVHAQNWALAYMVLALMTKVAVLSVLTPVFGYMGTAGGALAVEALVLLPMTLFMVHRTTGFAPPPGAALRIVAVVTGVLLAVGAVFSLGGLAATVVGAVLYPAVAVATGAVRLDEVRALLGGGG